MKSTIRPRTQTPAVRNVLKPLLKQHVTISRRGDSPSAPFGNVTHREVVRRARHCALWRYRDYRSSLDALPLYDHLIRTGAWWDVCDIIAQHLVGEVMMKHREAASITMRAWSTDDHLWIRRCSILSQNKHREQTDPDLLRTCILPSIDDTDFFSRKQSAGPCEITPASTQPGYSRL